LDDSSLFGKKRRIMEGGERKRDREMTARLRLYIKLATTVDTLGFNSTEGLRPPPAPLPKQHGTCSSKPLYSKGREQGVDTLTLTAHLLGRKGRSHPTPQFIYSHWPISSRNTLKTHMGPRIIPFNNETT
jgi:hypothetical protein